MQDCQPPRHPGRVARRECRRSRVPALLVLPSSHACFWLELPVSSSCLSFRVGFSVVLFFFCFLALQEEMVGREGRTGKTFMSHSFLCLFGSRIPISSLSPSSFAKSPEVTSQYQLEAFTGEKFFSFLVSSASHTTLNKHNSLSGTGKE